MQNIMHPVVMHPRSDGRERRSRSARNTRITTVELAVVADDCTPWQAEAATGRVGPRRAVVLEGLRRNMHQMRGILNSHHVAPEIDAQISHA